MEFESIANLVNQVAIERKGRPLKDVERLVLEGAWYHQTYGAMAQQAGGYTEDYLKKDVGPKLWRLLSDLIDQGEIRVTKRNIQNVLQHWAGQQLSSHAPDPALDQPPSSLSQQTGNTSAFASVNSDPLPLEVWASTRLDGSEFVGRQQDLTQLQRWLQEKDCRTILLWGLAGVGKTTLATRLLATQPGSSETMGYLSLRPGVTDEAFFQALVVWLRALNPQLSAPRREPLSWIMEQLEQRRYVLLIDQCESLFLPGHLAGTFGPNTRGIQRFFQQAAEQLHQSLVVWVSREKPLDLAQLRGSQVREYRLSDLPPEAVQTLLEERQLQGRNRDWDSLFDRYGGNPLLLKGIIATVQEVYQGQVGPFLSASGPAVPGLWREGMHQVLSHLTDLETVMLYWLALAHEPVPLTTLTTHMVSPPEATVIQSLLSRSLCHPTDPNPQTTPDLDLAPVVRSLLLDHLRSTLLQELLHHRFDVFNRLPLVMMTSREEVQELQRQALLAPLAEDLHQHYPYQQEITNKCQSLHQILRQTGPQHPGYGTTNFIHLCHQLGVSVSGVNFAHLSIWQGDLRYVNLQGTNFSHARFADTVFATALGRHPIMALSHGGRYLATGDQEGRLLLWELRQGRLIQVLNDGPAQAIRALAFSPGADLLAVGTDDGAIILWSLSERYHPDSLRGHGPPVLALTFSPDGSRLASANAAGQVDLWEVASGEQQRQWQRHHGAIHSLTFDDQGSMLLSSGDDQRACLWSWQEASTVTEFQAGPTVQLRAAGFMADPQWPHHPSRPMVAGYDEHALTLWNVETGRAQWSIPTDDQGILAIALDPGGQYLTCSYQDFSVALWQLPQQRMGYRLPPFNTPVWALIFSPEGQWFATAGDYTIKIWEAAGGGCLRSFLSQAHPVRCLEFTHLGNQLLTGHEDHTLRLWQLSEVNAFTARPGQFIGHTGAIRAIAVSPEGHRFATSANDATIRLWHDRSQTCNRVIASLEAAASVLAFNATGQWLACAGEDLPVMGWDTTTGSRIHFPEDSESPASCLAFGGHSRWLVSGSREGDLRLWDFQQGTCRLISSGHQGQIHSIVVNQQGTQFISASYDGSLRWWDLPQGKLLGQWHHHEGQWLQAVALGPQEEIWAITSQSHRVEVWDVTAQRCLHRLEGHSQDIWQVAISADRSRLATASQDDEIRLWRLDTGTCLQVLRPDRPYEGANILGAQGLTQPEETMLKALGAVVRYEE